MIRITDMTLSCLDAYSPSHRQLSRLLELLLELGVDVVELSPYACETIGALPEQGRYLLRVKSSDEIGAHPRFDRFLCRKAHRTENSCVTSELQVNDIRDIHFMSQHGLLENIRVTGFDDILNHDYRMAFGQVRSLVKGRLELCPENSYYCATGIAVEWILGGGTDVVTAFAGINGKAPTEEVLMSLRIAKRHRATSSMAVFPEICELISEIMSEQIPKQKAVIGKRIFDVESGIHVDGIIKNPQMYEPFLPELVGNVRRIVLGKYSGKKAVSVKLQELGLCAEEYNIAGILEAVKLYSSTQSALVDDAQLLRLTELHRN